MALYPSRQPSSTIAVNRHAVFLPHVDNGAGGLQPQPFRYYLTVCLIVCGAGAGQGISMIVALGDFIGGEVSTECLAALLSW